MELKGVIGLDLGTTCGWAYTTDQLRIHPALSGEWKLEPPAYAGGGMRFLLFRQRLQDLLRHFEYQCAIYFEEVRRHKGVHAAHMYGGWMAVLGEVCEDRDVPYASLKIADVKRRATGKGNAKKPAMMAAAEKKWGLEGPGGPDWKVLENQADALWILATGLAKLAGTQLDL